MSRNEILREELEVVNAIFGEGTCQIMNQEADKTRVKLKLSAPSYETFTPEWTGRKKLGTTGSWKRTTAGADLGFNVDFPAAYPQVIPQVVGLEISLFEYYEGAMWKTHAALLIFLNDVFRSGEVCIYDWFLRCTPTIHCLGRNGLDLAKYATIAPELNIDEKTWKWVNRKMPRDLKRALSRNECTVCLDEFVGYEMVDMVCGHVFCTDCFREGWDVAQSTQEPFACCNRRVPADMIHTFIELDDMQSKRYKQLLIERDTPQPVYCSKASCSRFLGGMMQHVKQGKTNARCPGCSVSTCIFCRNSGHGGECDLGEPESIMRHFAIRRCPYCGYATMKDGGCSHMTCKACGTHYTWQSDGGIVGWDT